MMLDFYNIEDLNKYLNFLLSGDPRHVKIPAASPVSPDSRGKVQTDTPGDEDSGIMDTRDLKLAIKRGKI